MKAFRIYLIAVIVWLGTYTMIVGLNHGWNLLPIFFGDMLAMTWLGQFNSDFMSFLTLSGLWLDWRHQFSLGGLTLGVLGIFGGMMVLAPYLLYASYQANGDVRVLLLGKEMLLAIESSFGSIPTRQSTRTLRDEAAQRRLLLRWAVHSPHCLT